MMEMPQEPSKPSIWRLLESRLPRTGATKLVGIDGHGGSGKSTLAELLADHLGAEIIHTDDFASWEEPLEWGFFVPLFVSSALSIKRKV